MPQPTSNQDLPNRASSTANSTAQRLQAHNLPTLPSASPTEFRHPPEPSPSQATAPSADQATTRSREASDRPNQLVTSADRRPHALNSDAQRLQAHNFPPLPSASQAEFHNTPIPPTSQFTVPSANQAVTQPCAADDHFNHIVNSIARGFQALNHPTPSVNQPGDSFAPPANHIPSPRTRSRSPIRDLSDTEDNPAQPLRSPPRSSASQGPPRPATEADDDCMLDLSRLGL